MQFTVIVSKLENSSLYITKLQEAALQFPGVTRALD